MLTETDLKTWLHGPMSQAEKLLLVLATFDEPASVADIKSRASYGGLKISKTWNPSTTLKRTGGLAISTPNGWELSPKGKAHLSDIGVKSASPLSVQIATDLRRHLGSIANSQVREFVEEAIKCHETNLHRSAVVMSWVGAIGVLHDHVVLNCLNEFNDEASRVDSRWKVAKNSDDLSRMKESDFLDRLVAISVIGKNVKERLKVQLDLRNACGHPNSFKIGPSVVASHIEVLLLNVFERFS